MSVPVAKNRFKSQARSLRRAALLVLTPLALTLASCGGGSADAPPDNANLGAPAAFAVGYTVKGYSFSWSPSVWAARYELYEDPDGAAGPLPETQIGGVLTGTSYAHSLAPQLLTERVNASYRVRACDASGCGAFSSTLVPDLTQAIGYFKASNSGKNDGYGASVALSADGSTLAVGAPGESSKATGIDGDQADNSVEGAGAVYVFARSGTGWSQQAYVKASNTKQVVNERGAPFIAQFGASVSLSGDGNILAVGSPNEASNATGVDGDQTNSMTPGAGAAFVFTRRSGAWSQQAYLKASNTAQAAQFAMDIVAGSYVRDPARFGSNVSLSADGKLLAVGAPGEASNATGINGNQQNTSAARAGAVYVFAQAADSWRQQTYLKASNTFQGAQFGASVALAADGRTLAVGAWGERSAATGINADQTDVSLSVAGAAYVFARNGDSPWMQQAYVKTSNPGELDQFGYSVALSAEGDTLAVGAIGESSNATGINSAPGVRSLIRAGAAYVFTRSAGNWSQQAYIKATNTQVDAWFGSSLALSADGGTLAVGAMAEASSGVGFNTNQADASAGGAGAVYLFQRGGNAWSQKAYMKASNTDAGDMFGSSVSLSIDGKTLAVGAPGEDSLATGIQGDQANNSGAPAGPIYNPVHVGAVYLY